MCTREVLNARYRAEKKTCDEQGTTGLSRIAREALINHYEDLRLQALGRGGLNRGLGLALLRRQGMRSWIESWSKCALPTSQVRDDSTGASVHSAPVELRGEITNILAGMALSYRSWEATK